MSKVDDASVVVMRVIVLTKDPATMVILVVVKADHSSTQDSERNFIAHCTNSTAMNMMR